MTYILLGSIGFLINGIEGVAIALIVACLIKFIIRLDDPE